jgi:hypothetical protein
MFIGYSQINKNFVAATEEYPSPVLCVKLALASRVYSSEGELDILSTLR